MDDTMKTLVLEWETQRIAKFQAVDQEGVKGFPWSLTHA